MVDESLPRRKCLLGAGLAGTAAAAGLTCPNAAEAQVANQTAQQQSAGNTSGTAEPQGFTTLTATRRVLRHRVAVMRAAIISSIWIRPTRMRWGAR
jgi:hypothetical protein